MNIFVFGTRGFPNIQGGVEKHSEYLYPLLSDQFRITVFRRQAFLQKENDSGFEGIRFIDLPSTSIKGVEALYHSFLCTLYCIVKRPDLVHIHNIGPGLFIPFLKLFRLKVVLTYHSPNYEHKKWGFFSRNLLKLGEKVSVRGADGIIFVNRMQMKEFPLDIRRKSAFIPNGVQRASRSVASDYLTTLGLTSSKYLLTVGRITQEKGLDYLIDAFLQADIAGYKLVLAGGIDHKSKYAEEILDKIKENPNVVMPGYVEGENLRQLYSHAAMFVLSSYNEGFPLVLLEAMNYQLPILASDIPGNRMLNLPEKSYFETGNVVALSNLLKQSLRRPLANQIYDLDQYSWEEVANQTEQMYSKVHNLLM